MITRPIVLAKFCKAITKSGGLRNTNTNDAKAVYEAIYHQIEMYNTNGRGGFRETRGGTERIFFTDCTCITGMYIKAVKNHQANDKQ